MKTVLLQFFPSDFSVFEGNTPPWFAKTYAHHFSISAKDHRNAPCVVIRNQVDMST